MLRKDDAKKVQRYLHDAPKGGHYSGDTLMHNVLRDEYYWSTIFIKLYMYKISIL